MLAGESDRLAGEELEDLTGARHFAGGFGKRLSLLPGQEPAEFVLAREDLTPHKIERREALLGR